MAQQNLSVHTHAQLTPREQFEAIYRDHARQITSHIAAHLHRGDRFLAEDLTAEAFIRLWRALDTGLKLDRPRGFLNTLAARVVAEHFRRRSSHEQATDFAASNHTDVTADASSTPHLAGLLAELETAKEHLAQAADAYKVINRRHAISCAALANASNPESVARAELRAARTGMLRHAALNDFRIAGEAVARARAAWNQSALHISAAADEQLPVRQPGATFHQPPATARRPIALSGTR